MKVSISSSLISPPANRERTSVNTVSAPFFPRGPYFSFAEITNSSSESISSEVDTPSTLATLVTLSILEGRRTPVSQFCMVRRATPLRSESSFCRICAFSLAFFSRCAKFIVISFQKTPEISSKPIDKPQARVYNIITTTHYCTYIIH